MDFLNVTWSPSLERTNWLDVQPGVVLTVSGCSHERCDASDLKRGSGILGNDCLSEEDGQTLDREVAEVLEPLRRN